MGFIAEISSAFVDVISRLMGAQSQGSRDPAIFLALVVAGIAIVWLRRVNSLLNEELLRTREVLLEKGRIDDLKLKFDDMSYKMNTELTNFSRQLQKDEKRIGSLEQKISSKSIHLEIDSSERTLEERLRAIEDSLGIALKEKEEKIPLEVEQSKSDAVMAVTAPETPAPEVPAISPWRLALEKTRQRLHKQLLELVARPSMLGSRFPEAIYEVLTEHGLSACWTAEFRAALDLLTKSSEPPSSLGERVEAILAKAIKQKLQAGGDSTILPSLPSQRPRVVMLLGGNSTERLEVAAELAMFLKELGAKLVLGDCNTSSNKNRDKLLAWGEGVGIPVLTPAGRIKASQIAYRSIHKAQDGECDLVLLIGPDSSETSEQNKEWNQLLAMIGRERPGAPHETLFIDNLSESEKSIPQAAPLTPTGLIFTGFDLSDRGGLIMSRSEELKAPVRFVVMSQPRRQLQPFSPDDFATAICGTDMVDVPRGPLEKSPDHSL